MPPKNQKKKSHQAPSHSAPAKAGAKKADPPQKPASSPLLEETKPSEVSPLIEETPISIHAEKGENTKSPVSADSVADGTPIHGQASGGSDTPTNVNVIENESAESQAEEADVVVHHAVVSPEGKLAFFADELMEDSCPPLTLADEAPSNGHAAEPTPTPPRRMPSIIGSPCTMPSLPATDAAPICAANSDAVTSPLASTSVSDGCFATLSRAPLITVPNATSAVTEALSLCEAAQFSPVASSCPALSPASCAGAPEHHATSPVVGVRPSLPSSPPPPPPPSCVFSGQDSTTLASPGQSRSMLSATCAQSASSGVGDALLSTGRYKRCAVDGCSRLLTVTSAVNLCSAHWTDVDGDGAQLLEAPQHRSIFMSGVSCEKTFGYAMPATAQRVMTSSSCTTSVSTACSSEDPTASRVVQLGSAVVHSSVPVCAVDAVRSVSEPTAPRPSSAKKGARR